MVLGVFDNFGGLWEALGCFGETLCSFGETVGRFGKTVGGFRKLWGPRAVHADGDAARGEAETRAELPRLWR